MKGSFSVIENSRPLAVLVKLHTGSESSTLPGLESSTRPRGRYAAGTNLGPNKTSAVIGRLRIDNIDFSHFSVPYRKDLEERKKSNVVFCSSLVIIAPILVGSELVQSKWRVHLQLIPSHVLCLMVNCT
jgi:hypothetical protein